MECNKDEAVRAKEIAERKFAEGDFSSSKKFALKAQNLYSGLQGLSDLLMILDVYISAENVIAGEKDWYGILGVNPWANDEMVKKQFRKLALSLHPDKNKFIGADGAFKLVSEAWNLLSDKAKRLAYNKKRNLRVFQQKVPGQGRGPSSTPANGQHNFSNSATSNPMSRDSSSNVGPPSAPTAHQKSNTFWTICNGCKTHYEYLRVYLNNTLLCPNCHEAFFATERGPPPNIIKPANLSSRQQHHNSSDYTNLPRGSFSSTAGIGSKVRLASTAGHVQASGEQERSYASKRMSNSTLKVELDSKKRKIDDNYINSHGRYVTNQMATRNVADLGCAFGLRKGYPEGERIYGFSSTYNIRDSTRELSLFETRNILVEKAKVAVKNKLKEWREVTGIYNADKGKENENQSTVNGNVGSQNKKGSQMKNSVSDPAGSDSDKEAKSPMSMSVPDSDFHNFDTGRTEESFGDDQVWASYDNDDGMPRYYARIHKVISLKPFKMRFGWLNSRSCSEFGPLDWIGSGFSKTCGEFRTGRFETIGSINSFSHKVEWSKGARGVLCIYPRKGDVWALYKNWSPDWDEHTGDEIVHKYEMVEVLEGYNEEQGVSVASLVKVTGFRTVFHKHTEQREVKQIPKEEMFRFSHQVPYYLLTGAEASNAPKGCMELDPAATPLEFVQLENEPCEAQNVNDGTNSVEMVEEAQELKADAIKLNNESKDLEVEIDRNCEQSKGNGAY